MHSSHEQEVAKNPKNPSFNHYVFEAVAGLVKNSCSGDPAQCAHFEGLLFPPFQHILELDVQVSKPAAAPTRLSSPHTSPTTAPHRL